MDEELKSKILLNRFIYEIRYRRIDRHAYGELRTLLVELARAWDGVQCIDKQVAGRLYDIPSVAKGAFSKLATANPDTFREVEDLVEELDALILECFDTPDPPETSDQLSSLRG